MVKQSSKLDLLFVRYAPGSAGNFLIAMLQTSDQLDCWNQQVDKSKNTDQFELLRLRYPLSYGCYPTVSGNKYRYAIRFMQLCDAQGRATSDKNISFDLACC